MDHCKGSNPTNPPILSKTKVNLDVEEMDNALPMKTKATTIVPNGTKDSIEKIVFQFWS